MKNKNLIAISGKKGSGKDTVGTIITMLEEGFSKESIAKTIKSNKKPEYNYEIKKFADKVKDIVCLLLNCTKEQLEDRDFKEKELGVEWWIYKLHDGSVYRKIPKREYDDLSIETKYTSTIIEKPTPRRLMQLIGTECGRDIIHPNIWINALFSEYIPTTDKKLVIWDASEDEIDLETDWVKVEDKFLGKYPKWVITDLRFPNEIEAVEKRSGITIRVNRPSTVIVTSAQVTEAAEKEHNRIKELFFGKEHESETALDDYEDFNHVVNNDGIIEELIDKVEEILIIEGII